MDNDHIPLPMPPHPAKLALLYMNQSLLMLRKESLPPDAALIAELLEQLVPRVESLGHRAATIQ